MRTIRSSRSMFHVLAFFALLASLVGGALTFKPAYANNITVNTADDVTNSTDGKCSLREAVTAAENNATSGGVAGECGAGGAGTDGIYFAAAYTINLGSALPDIGTSMYISGQGRYSTIIEATDCDPINLPGACTPASYRIFQVLGTGSLGLSNMTIRYGNVTGTEAGGAIKNLGSVSLSDMLVQNNNAGGLGGAIFSSGLVYVYGASFVNNRSNGASGGGGAIYSNSATQIYNTTFEGNSATDAAAVGGAVFLGGGGGAPYIANGTFKDNSASSGGGLYNASTASVYNSTFSGNSADANHGGAIENAGTLTLKNNLLANSSGTTVDCYNTGGDTLAGDVNNLIEGNGPSGHKCGTPTVTTDPGTLTYGDHGGGGSTFAIDSSSSAYNAGDNTTCAAAPVGGTDARQFPRPAPCDIGSFELHLPPANDEFANTEAIGSLPFSVSTLDIRGATTALSDPAFPSPVGMQRYASVWYSLTLTAPRWVSVDTFTSTYDTVLAVYTGSEGSLTGIVANDDTAGHSTQSFVRFFASAGTTYSIEVGGFGPFPNGDLTMHVSGLDAAKSDFNGDGDTDPGVVRPSDHKWYVNGSPAVSWYVSGDIPVPGDYNGDGNADVAVYRPSDGKWYVKDQFSIPWGIPGDIPVPGDYNGDGTTDLAVFRPSDGKWYVRNLFNIAWGASGDIPVPADYNNDGITDPAVVRPSDHKWYVKDQFTVSWYVAGDIPVPADYNGNGFAEVAVYRPSEGKWYIKDPSSTTPWGIAGDIPVPGDYNADGMIDIAVWRPSDGKWYVRNQFNLAWGANGDWPLPAPDTNGDGDPYQ